jgi:uncharacterized protein (TIGR03083 family)
MIDRSRMPDPFPSTLVLRTAGPCNLAPEHLVEVFGRQRRRFVIVLQGFGPDDWMAPTRCADWCVHDVIRHLCDCNAIATAIAAGSDGGALDVAGGFDPRRTPRGWLTASAGESAEATLSRFVETTEQLISVTHDRLAQRCRFDVRLPYGPMDWTVGLLHAFWDSWIHERDVLLAQGADHPTDDHATAYAAAYGLFITIAVASMFGAHVRETLTLGGAGGGVFDLDNRGVVTLTFTRMTAAGVSAGTMTDALAGRGDPATLLGELPANSRGALGALANFFNTPVD